METALQSIHRRQREWATNQKVPIDEDNYTLAVNDNLFSPLSKEATLEIGSGRGSELKGLRGKPPKIRALHSSVALVYNVFEYWRTRCIDPIASFCFGSIGMDGFRYEQTHFTGAQGAAPHLDVEFFSEHLKPVAIESKFIEPYRDRPKNMPPVYFESRFQRKFWENIPRCEKLAKELRKNENRFAYLDVSQLLKHIIGLTRDYRSDFELVYLWYEVSGSKEARIFRDELSKFQEYTAREISFHPLTYQELFARIKGNPSADSEYVPYVSYLTKRYFS